MKLEAFLHKLVPPADDQPLRIIETSNAAGGQPDWAPIPRVGGDAQPIGKTDRILVCEDGQKAFPIVDEIPVLLAPEMLVPSDQAADFPPIDLADPRYAEAYEEMDFYNTVRESQLDGTSKEALDSTMGALRAGRVSPAECDGFPEPSRVWIDAKHDSLSQLQAYRFLAPVKDKLFLQMGGSGSHAVKMLVAGARQALLLTPMLGEARYALKLAEHYGVADRLGCVLAVGEELPFVKGGIDIVYSGGCFHHMRLDYVAAELSRVLSDGGKFSGVDPWKTPLHTIGTKLVGKRETSVYCRPINEERLKPVRVVFPDLEVRRNGPFLRYLFLGLEKFGVSLPRRCGLGVMRIDNLLGRLTCTLNRWGGSLVIAGEKKRGAS